MSRGCVDGGPGTVSPLAVLDGTCVPKEPNQPDRDPLHGLQVARVQLCGAEHAIELICYRKEIP